MGVVGGYGVWGRAGWVGLCHGGGCLQQQSLQHGNEEGMDRTPCTLNHPYPQPRNGVLTTHTPLHPTPTPYPAGTAPHTPCCVCVLYVVRTRAGAAAEKRQQHRAVGDGSSSSSSSLVRRCRLLLQALVGVGWLRSARVGLLKGSILPGWEAAGGGGGMWTAHVVVNTVC